MPEFTRGLAECGARVYGAGDQPVDALPELVKNAFADPSLRTNPRMPMLAEMAELLTAAYEGRPED